MYRKFILVLVMLNVMACSTVSTPEPTATIPPPTNTPKPTPTSTPLPAPTATNSFHFGDMKMLATSEGYSLYVPTPLLYQVSGNIVQVTDTDNTLNISFAGDQSDGTIPLPEVIDSYLASLEKRGFQFTKQASVDIQAGGADGIAIDLTGDVSNIPFEGRVIAVSPRSDFILFGLGIAKTDKDPASWKNMGEPVFESLLTSVKFTDVNASCPVSTDKTYGYKEENPIQVGGGDFDGPSRERAYLDHLLGPNGGKLTYERGGSLMSGDVILDEYHVTDSGIDAVIYIDEYNFSEPMAPVGFTCNGAFPLSAP